MKLILLSLVSLLELQSNCLHPCHPKEFLFFIQRSLDDDKIIYSVNTTYGGKIDPNDPIKICWMNNKNGGSLGEVPIIKKKFGYGLTIHEIANETVKFSFVSNRTDTLVLKKNREGHFRTFFKITDDFIEVEKIYIKMDGVLFWDPGIQEIAILGISENYLKPVTHYIPQGKMKR